MVFLAASQDDYNRFAGAMILKKTRDEKKICTLYVHGNFRRRGIGTAFMDIAREKLDDQYPVITISELREAEFAPFLQQFGFKLYDRYNGYYRSGVSELSYNGPIEPIRVNFIQTETVFHQQEPCKISSENNQNKFLDWS